MLAAKEVYLATRPQPSRLRELLATLVVLTVVVLLAIIALCSPAKSAERCNELVKGEISEFWKKRFLERCNRVEALQKLADERSARNKSQGCLEFRICSPLQLIPLWSETSQSTPSLGEQLEGSDRWLPGNNKIEQFSYLHSLPPEESIAKTKLILSEMDAVQGDIWLADLVEGYSTMDAYLANIFFSIDLAVIAFLVYFASRRVLGINHQTADPRAPKIPLGNEIQTEQVERMKAAVTMQLRQSYGGDAASLTAQVMHRVDSLSPDERRLKLLDQVLSLTVKQLDKSELLTLLDPKDRNCLEPLRIDGALSKDVGIIDAVPGDAPRNRIGRIFKLSLVIWLGGNTLYWLIRPRFDPTLENLMLVTDFAGLIAIAIILYWIFRALRSHVQGTYATKLHSEHSGGLASFLQQLPLSNLNWQLVARRVAIAMAALLLYWYIDVSWTVRSKIALLEILPLSENTVNDMTYTLCKSAVGDEWRSCYEANR